MAGTGAADQDGACIVLAAADGGWGVLVSRLLVFFIIVVWDLFEVLGPKLNKQKVNRTETGMDWAAAQFQSQ